MGRSSVSFAKKHEIKSPSGIIDKKAKNIFPDRGFNLLPSY
jgi:hypothetical protein